MGYTQNDLDDIDNIIASGCEINGANTTRSLNELLAIRSQMLASISPKKKKKRVFYPGRNM